ncbi:MAG: 50S ribosomal protein L25 [Chloroflexota bacterium]
MDNEIGLDARTASGKANKRLRREGIVPGVIFGLKSDSIPVQVDARTFELLYKRAGRTSVVNLKVDDARGATSAVIKNVQRHPLTGRAIHVDFLRVDLKAEMETDVPLNFSGTAPAVERSGGTLVTNVSSVRVRALPNEIPHEIVVDVSTLVSLDVAIHVRDLSLNRDQVTVMTDADELVAKVLPPRVEEEIEPVEAVEGEAAEGEGAEGETAAGEGGEATSEGQGTSES